MGRKIPGKKHRGVKDPFKQQAKRNAELENKINAPPKDVDEQAIPKSLERVVKLKEAVKSGKITAVIKKKKKKKKNALICVGAENSKPLHPKAKPDKVVPIFKQWPGETPEHFLHRVARDTNAFVNETAFEKKYGVQVKRSPQTGEVLGVTKCPKDELEEIEKLRAKHNNVKKKKKVSDKPEMSKAEKRKEKLRLKKQKKEQEDINEFETLKDQVAFGEVAHEPPQLKSRPRKANCTSTEKPGKKDLLLNTLFANKVAKTSSNKVSAINRSGRRKNLPLGERRQLEKQQHDIIAAYRKLKAQRTIDAGS